MESILKRRSKKFVFRKCAVSHDSGEIFAQAYHQSKALVLASFSHHFGLELVTKCTHDCRLSRREILVSLTISKIYDSKEKKLNNFV